MKDIDRVISQALASEAERFVPDDLAGAEQRFLRSRRRRRFTWFTGATLATAAAVVAVAVFPRPDLARNEEPTPAAAGIAATVEVGDAPTAVAAGADAVWVANAGEGTVTRIDPVTNRVVATISVGGTPDEIAIGPDVVWVARSDNSSVLRIDPSSNEMVSEGGGQVVGDGGPGHLDLAVQGSDLWVVHAEDRQVIRITPVMTQYLPGNLRATDVTMYPDGPGWTYDGATGVLRLVAREEGESHYITVEGVPVSEHGDLAVGGGAVWVSNDLGTIARVEDSGDFRKSHIDVGGRHSDLSYGGGYLWALTANEADDGTATLRQIDPVTAQVVGQEFALEGDPVDVSADDDAVWVANQDADTVTRIDVTPPKEI